MTTLDARMLLAGRGVEAPDWLGDAQKASVLANLAQTRQMQQMQMDQARRSEASQRGIGDALGDVDITDDFQVRKALTTMPPESRQGFLAYVVEQRKKLADMRKDDAETDKKRTETKAAQYAIVGGIAGTLAKQPTREGWQAARSTLQRMGMDPSVLDVPDGVDPQQHFAQIADGAMTRAQQMHVEDQAAGRKLTERGQDITTRGQDMTDTRAREFNAAQMANAAANREQARALRESGMAQANATRAASADRRTVDVEMKLADDYRTQSKGWQETATAIGKVRTALSTASTNPGSALAAGTAFMKILDPNSVVRESELGMALNASGWFDRAANVAQVLRSGRVMTPQQTRSLREASDALFNEAAATQRKIDAAYAKRAKDYGVDASRVIVDLGQNGEQAQPGNAKLRTAPAGSGADYVYTPGQ